MKKHTLELTDEQIDKYGLRELVPFTGWAKTKEGCTWMGYFENNILKYGILPNGKWFSFKYFNYAFNTHLERPATDEEIEKGLIGMAERLGLLGCKVFKDAIDGRLREDGVLKFREQLKGKQNQFWTSYGCIYYKGNWAEIIEEPLTLEQRIERIEKHLEIWKPKK